MASSFIQSYLKLNQDKVSPPFGFDYTLRMVLLASSLLLTIPAVLFMQHIGAYVAMPMLCVTCTAILPIKRGSLLVCLALVILAFGQGFNDQAGLFLLAGMVAGSAVGFVLRWAKATICELQNKAKQHKYLIRLFDAMTRVNHHSVKLLDAEGQLQLINKQGMKLMRMNSEEKLKWQRFLLHQKPEQQKALQAAFEQALASGYSELSGPFINAKGEVNHCRVCMAGMPNGDGGYESVLAVTQDITTLVESQLEAERNNLELSELLDNLEGVFVAFDEQQQMLFTNARARDFFRAVNSNYAFADHDVLSLEDCLPSYIYNAVSTSIEEIRGGKGNVCIQIQEPGTGRWLAVELYKKTKGFNLFVRDTDEQHTLHLQHKEALLIAEMAQELELSGSWVYNLDTREIDLSAQACKILNVQKPFQTNRGLSLLEQRFLAKDRIKLTQAIIAVTQSDTSISMHTKVQHESGEVADVRIALRCLFDDRHNAVKVIGSVQDVTEQKTREAYLFEAERLVRGMIDALPNQICVIDSTGTLINVNKSWHDGDDQSVGSRGLVGKGANYLRVCDESAQQGCEDARRAAGGIRAVISGQQQSYEAEYCLVNGEQENWFVIRVNPLYSPDKDISSDLFVISHEDISALKSLMLEGEAQREQLQLVQRSTNDGLWDWQAKTNTTHYSTRFCALLGMPSTRLPNFIQWLSCAVLPAQLLPAMEELECHFQQQTASFDIECQLQCGNGEYRWFRLRGKGQFIDNQLQRFVGSIMDINEYRTLLEELSYQQQKFTEMAEHIPDVFWDYDISGDQFLYVSPAYEGIWQHEPLIGESGAMEYWTSTVIDKDRKRVVELHESAIATGNPGFAEYRIQTSTGDLRWISSRCFVVKDEQGRPQRLVGTVRDVTQSKLTLSKLKTATELDSLTGLDNRHTFIAKLDRQLRDRRQNHFRFAIVFIDIDRLTTLNDSVGYEVGDKLLQQVAIRLRDRCPADGAIARVGGDEFAMLLPLNNDEAQLSIFLSDLLSSFNPPFLIDHHNLFVTASAGASMYPRDGQTSLELLRLADAALQEVKVRGGGFFQLCEAIETNKNAVSGHLESELKRALDHKQFVLYYQPKVNTESGLPVGCEALLRWQHPEEGLVPPLAFMGQLENTGLIVPVGEYVLNQSLIQLNQWLQGGFTDLVMAVNVSPRQLLAPGFVDIVRQALTRHKVSPQRLELELTETALVTDPTLAVEVMSQLKDMGVSVAIDDFGTGYSSLSYLRAFKPHTVKIDKQFVDNIERDEEAYLVLAGIVSMCEKLSIETVAEGVELESQWSLLRKVGCTELQGYLFARPMPAADFTREILELSRDTLQHFK